MLLLLGACRQLRDVGETNVEVDPCGDAEGMLSLSIIVMVTLGLHCAGHHMVYFLNVRFISIAFEAGGHSHVLVTFQKLVIRRGKNA